MRVIFRLLKIVGLLVGVAILALVGLLVVTFSGGAPIQDGQRLGAVEVVKDGFVSAFIIDIGNNDVALVDAGNDRQAKTILAALAKRNLGADAVKAILLTHGDRDHTAGVAAFPHATVMALEADIALAEGRELRGFFRFFGSPHANGIKVVRALHDGESLTLGNQLVRVFAVPGHTKGSAAFLVAGVLFLGDSADARHSGTLAAGRWLFTENPAQNRASLRKLLMEIKPWAVEVKAIACAHSGMLTSGLNPLFEFVALER
jgi:glyoxylase-like metal-dependent hydrolase (beta-lactamase superfamily II)